MGAIASRRGSVPEAIGEGCNFFFGNYTSRVHQGRSTGVRRCRRGRSTGVRLPPGQEYRSTAVAGAGVQEYGRPGVRTPVLLAPGLPHPYAPSPPIPHARSRFALWNPPNAMPTDSTDLCALLALLTPARAIHPLALIHLCSQRRRSPTRATSCLPPLARRLVKSPALSVGSSGCDRSH